MSEAKRYFIFEDGPFQSDDGYWVKYSDHLSAMEALREAKDREIEGWKGLLMTAIAHIQLNHDDKEAADQLIEMSVAFEKEPK